MELGLESRTALVTGASAGIGRRIAAALAGEGVTVVGAARRVDLIEDLAARTGPASGAVLPVRYDLREAGAQQDLARRAAELAGPIDILVNVVGGYRRLEPAAPTSAWDDAMFLNFGGTRVLTELVLPSMRERGWGRVISLAGSFEPPAMSGLSAAKAAVAAWSKSLSRVVGPDGVTVNCIQPGRIHSEQVARLFPTAADEAAEIVRSDIPLRRFGEPEEVAGVAVFLASAAASYISGAVVPVDGGLRRYAF